METTPPIQTNAVPPSAPTTAQLPVRLRDLLKREVCLDLSRARIEAALNEVERDSQELRKTRPPFLFLQGKSTRSEFETRQNSAAESLTALTQGLQNVTAAQPRIRAWVEDDLETFLRDSQPAYVQGLANHRYSDDWQRAIVRFDQRVASLRSALGQLQVALGTVPGGVLLASHPGAFECLMPARQWAALLDYEFVFFNRVADAQRRAASLGSDTLKRMPEHQFSIQVGRWARMEGVSARRSMLELRAHMELAVMDARATYVAEGALAAGGNVGNSFVYPTWEALRQLMRLEIDPNEVEAIVAETERMVAAAGG